MGGHVLYVYLSVFLCMSAQCIGQNRRLTVYPTSLNYRWINEAASDQSKEMIMTDQILRRVFSNHIDGFPYCADSGSPLKVDLAVTILSMLGIEEQTKMVELSARFIMTWKHCDLRWDPAEYDGIKKIEVPRSVAVWTPDLTWIERPEKDFSWRTQARLTLSSEGQLELVGQAIVKHACPTMHFTMFPFDAHRCEITFVSLSHDGYDIQLSVSMINAADLENGTRRIQSMKSATSEGITTVFTVLVYALFLSGYHRLLTANLHFHYHTLLVTGSRFQRAPGLCLFNRYNCLRAFSVSCCTSSSKCNMSVYLRHVHRQLDFNSQSSLDTEQWTVRLSSQRICQHDMFHFDDLNETLSNGTVVSKYSESTCLIYLQRRPLYHMFSLFTPASLITLLTAFAFLIPPNEGDAKIGFALTIMLQLLVFMMYMYQRLPVAATEIPLMTQYFSLCILIVALSVLMTVVIAYIGWLGDDLIAMPHCLDVCCVRMLGRVLVREHLKVLKRWEAHVAQSDKISASVGVDPVSTVPIMRTVRVDPVNESETETAFMGSKECAEEQTEELVMVEMRKPAENVAIMSKFHVAGRTVMARSISKVEQPQLSDPCEDDRASLTRARWALMALVVDKLCFLFFLTAIVFCIVYHVVVGCQFWYAFIYD